MALLEILHEQNAVAVQWCLILAQLCSEAPSVWLFRHQSVPSWSEGATENPGPRELPLPFPFLLLSINIWFSDASSLSSAELSIHWIREAITLHISNWDIFLSEYSGCNSVFPPVHATYYLVQLSTCLWALTVWQGQASSFWKHLNLTYPAASLSAVAG